MYWFSLTIIPTSVISCIKRRIFHFLWERKLDISKFHLSSWESIDKPKKLSEWGFKNLEWFNMALCAKSLWHCLFADGLWGKVIKSKYIKSQPLIHWICDPVKNCYNSSLIWWGFMKSYPILGYFLCWKVGLGP